MTDYDLDRDPIYVGRTPSCWATWQHVVYALIWIAVLIAAVLLSGNALEVRLP